MSDFHFLRPHLLFLLLPFLVLVFLFIRTKGRSNIWSSICDKNLLPFVLAGKGKRFYMPYILVLSLGTLLITALAGPAWQQIPQPLNKSQGGLVIALDLSAAMDAQDIKPSRLQRAIYKLNDLLSLHQEGQTALIVFSGEPFVVTPLTDDVATIKALLPVLETKIMPVAGHQVDKAVSKGIELLAQGGISRGSILLLTADISKAEMEKAIEIAAKEKIKVSVLGIGTAEGSPIQKEEGGFIKDDKGSVVMSMLSKENLMQLTKETEGTYATLALDDTDIHQLISGLSQFDPKESQKEVELTQNKWHDQGYLLILIALPFVSLLFRRGLCLILPLLFMPPAVHAFTWNDLWKTPDQQAEELFLNEKYPQAKELFRQSDWQGAVNYRLGEYEAAAQFFANDPSAEGYYNYGTAKAKQGEFETALEAYNKALEIQPGHADALYNKKLIEELMQQQQKQEDQKEDQDQSKEKNQDQGKDQNSDGKQSDQHDDSQESQEKKPDQGKEQNSESSQSDQREDSQKGKREEKEEQADSQKDSQEVTDQQREELEALYRKAGDKERKENKGEEQIAQAEEPAENEQRQIDERWLQRIHDDPGGLLRRKFLYQYRQQ